MYRVGRVKHTFGISLAGTTHGTTPLLERIPILHRRWAPRKATIVPQVISRKIAPSCACGRARKPWLVGAHVVVRELGTPRKRTRASWNFPARLDSSTAGHGGLLVQRQRPRPWGRGITWNNTADPPTLGRWKAARPVSEAAPPRPWGGTTSQG